MPAARYWRIVGIETYTCGDLELSELHLYGASGRMDATVTLTSTVAPTAGTLAALQDDNLDTTCRFAAAAVRAGGFALAWDFGAGNTANAIGVRLGASADPAAFMAGCTLQYSTDGTQWQVLVNFARYAWPGAGAYTIAPEALDEYYAEVALLLHMDGANGGTTFTDNSRTPKTVTTIGSAATSTAQSKFGGASGLFGGASSGLSVADSAEFGAGSDFTIEGWIRPNSVTGAKAIVSKRTAGTIEYQLLLSGDKLYLDAQSGGGVLSLTGITAMALGSWYHVAATKSGNMWRIFLNGALQASGTALATYSASGAAVTIGWSAAVPAWGYAGYIDDLRITKGVARYTADFTPPTEAFPSDSSGPAIFLPPFQHTSRIGVSIAASAPVPAFSTPLAARMQLARDVEHGGPGTIYGTTKTKGSPANTPTKARVVLLHQRSKLPVRETWSDPVTGNFAFSGIDTTQQFLTLAEDAAGNFRPVAANRLTPEVLP